MWTPVQDTWLLSIRWLQLHSYAHFWKVEKDIKRIISVNSRLTDKIVVCANCTRKPFEMNFVHSPCLVYKQQMGGNDHNMGRIGSDNEYYKLFHMAVSNLGQTFSFSPQCFLQIHVHCTHKATWEQIYPFKTGRKGKSAKTEWLWKSPWETINHIIQIRDWWTGRIWAWWQVKGILKWGTWKVQEK